MQLYTFQSQKSGQKVFGPVITLLAALLAVEAMLSLTGFQVQYVELWLVLAVIPLGLVLMRQPKKQPSVLGTKKLAPFDEDQKKEIASTESPSTQHSRCRTQRSHPRSEKPLVFSDAAKAAERTDEKARIEACIKAKDLEGAEACLGRLAEKNNVDAVCYNMVISLCGKLGQIKQAHAWMQRMLDAGVRPDVASFNTAIDAFARVGDITGAEHWLKRMETAGMCANTITYNAVINACARASDVPRAQWWMSRLCQNGTPDVVSYTSVINACAKQGDLRGAELWLTKIDRKSVV